MAGVIDAKLAELGIRFSAPVTPAGNYVPWVTVGDLVHLAGQVPVEDGVRKFVGKVGRELSLDDGQKAAELCGVNLVMRLKEACGGDLDRVVRCVKLVGFVNSTEDFGDHPKVINGASDLMVRVFGDAGRHVRSAVGAVSLPFGVATEVEGVFQIRI